MSQRISITDHAIVRYLERVLGMDMEAIRREICPPEVEKLARAIRSGNLPVPGKRYRLAITNFVVTTILTPEGRPPRARQNRQSIPGRPDRDSRDEEEGA